MKKQTDSKAETQQIRLLNRPKEVQEILRISNDTFYSLVRSGALRVSRPSGKLTYVSGADLQAFIDSGYPAQQPGVSAQSA